MVLWRRPALYIGTCKGYPDTPSVNNDPWTRPSAVGRGSQRVAQSGQGGTLAQCPLQPERCRQDSE